MSTMKDTTLRCLRVLRMIPRYPAFITTENLEMKLNGIGYRITRRTIQRDLIKLSEIFPIFCVDEDTREKQWAWRDDIGLFDLPNMSPLTALTFTLIKQYLSRALPLSIYRHLNPYFHQAQQYLDGLEKTNIGRWHEKFRIIPRGQQLIPAEIEENTLGVIYDALLRETQFEGVYRNKGATEPKTYTVHPLGLVFRPEITYLVCTLRDYTDIKQLALNRFVAASPTTLPRKIPQSFDLDDYIGTGSFSYPVQSQAIQLEVLFETNAAEHLYETPLTEKQRLSREPDGRIRLQATVTDTHELRWWLKGFGSMVEVKAPAALRKVFKQNALETAICVFACNCHLQLGCAVVACNEPY
jgi:predicted DNA-binding transcriptional regulator YafY